MVGGLVGFWCIRPWLGSRSFNYGQFAVLLATWKVASLLCLPTQAWSRFTPLRFLAYCVFIGMQPRQFLAGQRTAANAPIPTLAGIIGNAVTGAGLLWLVPRALPAAHPGRAASGWPCRLLPAVLVRPARFRGADIPRDGIRG